MKKIIFLFIAIIISACSPQVTVTSTPQTSEVSETSEVLTPTPTLHPEFIAWQEIISSSARYTLTPDGLIQENGVAIAGLQLDSNGVMTLTVDNEKIILNTSDIAFTKDEIKIIGYELNENGEWVEAVSEAMQMATGLIDQYSVDPETVTVTEEGSLVSVTDNETGKVLIRSNGIQSWFEIGFAADTIAAKSCEPTDFKPSKSGLVLAEYAKASSDYMVKIKEELNYPRVNGAILYDLLIDRENQCWGQVYNSKDLLYRDAEGVAHKLPLITLTKEEIEAFQISR